MITGVSITSAQEHGRPLRWGVPLGAALLLIVLWLWGPEGLYAPAREVGYAVCHQIPARSYWAWDLPLPLCARCTGQYLGALVMVGYILWQGRSRGGRFPPPPVTMALAGFLVLWAVDGLNSYLAFLNLPHAYTPRNALRLLTGLLQGTALVAFFWPLFAASTWRRITPTAPLLTWHELATVLSVNALLGGLILFGDDRIRHALGLISTAGVILLLSLVLSLPARMVLRREGTSETTGELILFLGLGLVLALGLLAAVNTLRADLTARLGFTLPNR